MMTLLSPVPLLIFTFLALSRGLELDAVAPFYTPLYGSACTTLDNFMYCVGGIANSVYPYGQYYNPQLNTWTTIAPMSISRFTGSLVTVDNTIWYLGGRNSANVNQPFLSSIEVYSPITNTWTLSPITLPSPLTIGGAAVVGSSLYVFSTQLQILPLNIMPPQWTSTNIPRQRYGAVYAAYNDRYVYMAGGQTTFTEGILAANYFDKYDTVTNTWHELVNMPYAVRGAVGFIIDTRLFVIGGSVANFNFASVVQTFDLISETWTSYFDSSIILYEAASTTVGEYGYIVGGLSYSTYHFPVNQCLRVLPSTVSPTPTRTVSPTGTPSTSPSVTSSSTKSVTSTRSASRTASNTRSQSSSVTSSRSPSHTTSPSITTSRTCSQSPSHTPSFSSSRTASRSPTPISTRTSTSTRSRTFSITTSRSRTSTKSGSRSRSPTPSLTSSPSLSHTSTLLASNSSSISTSASSSSSRTSSASRSSSLSSTKSAAMFPSLTPSKSASNTLSLTSTESSSRSSSRTATLLPSSSLSPSSLASASSSRTLSTSNTPSRTESSSRSSSRTATLLPSSSLSHSSLASASSSRTLSTSNTPSRTESTSHSLSRSLTGSKSASRTLSISRTQSRSSTMSKSNSWTHTLTKSLSKSPSSSGALMTSTPTPPPSLSGSYSTSPTAISTISSSHSPTLSTIFSKTSSASHSLASSSKSSIFISTPEFSSSKALLPATPMPPEQQSNAFSKSSTLLVSPSISTSPSRFVSPLEGSFVALDVSVGAPPVQVLLTNDQTQNVGVTFDNDNNAVAIKVPPKLSGTLSVSIADRNEAQLVTKAELASSVLVLTLINEQGDNVENLDVSVELCFSASKEDESHCLGYYNEKSKEWECQDKCLKQKNGLFCGETDHFTNFALLLMGRGDDCGNKDQYLLGDGWSDFALIMSVVAVVLLIGLVIILLSYTPFGNKMMRGEEGARIHKARQHSALEA